MNRRFAGFTLTLLAIFAAASTGFRFAAAQEAAGAIASFRFAAIDVFVDSDEPVAAWQFELSEATGAMAVVGVENGDSDAFGGAPHYDLEAVAADRADRIVVADFSLAQPAQLPQGRTRIATVHVRLAGLQTPEFELNLIAAGNAAGESLPADLSFELQDGRAP